MIKKDSTINKDAKTKTVHIQFDPELHTEMRFQAIREDKSIRQFFEDVIRQYLNSVKSEV